MPFIDLGLFNELKMPLCKCFLADFEKWHKQNNYPIGQQLYIYDSYMNEINLILSCELPKISVAKYQDDKYEYLDNDKFINDFYKNIQRKN